MKLIHSFTIARIYDVKMSVSRQSAKKLIYESFIDFKNYTLHFLITIIE